MASNFHHGKKSGSPEESVIGPSKPQAPRPDGPMTLLALDPDRPWPDKERRYVSGAFITLNDKMRERLWQRCMPRRWRRRASRRSRGEWLSASWAGLFHHELLEGHEPLPSDA